MNVLDIGIILIMIMFLIVGFKNGVIKELASLIGMIVIFIVAFALKGIVGNFLCVFFPFFTFSSGALEGLVTINIFIYQTIAFLLIFGVLLAIYEVFISISKFVQKIVNMTIILIIPSKILGALVSFIKCWIVIFVILVVLVIPFKNREVLEYSKLGKTVLYHTPVLSHVTEKFTTSLEEIFALTSQVAKNEISTNEANLKTLDVMLKYKIVTTDTIHKLKAKGKLDEIKNIDSVLEKYEE